MRECQIHSRCRRSQFSTVSKLGAEPAHRLAPSERHRRGRRGSPGRRNPLERARTPRPTPTGRSARDRRIDYASPKFLATSACCVSAPIRRYAPALAHRTASHSARRIQTGGSRHTAGSAARTRAAFEAGAFGSVASVGTCAPSAVRCAAEHAVRWVRVSFVPVVEGDQAELVAFGTFGSGQVASSVVP